MGSAFDVEWTIPATVRREQCVMFAWGAGDLVCHVARPECPIEHPHDMTTCGCFDPPATVEIPQ